MGLVVIDSKMIWDSLTVQQRVTHCKDAGLRGKVGSREWDSLTTDERLALSGVSGLINLLGRYESRESVVLDMEPTQAELDYWDNKRAGMRSIASDIVSQILANKFNMEG